MKENVYKSIEGLKKINLLLVIFIAFGVKSLILSPNFASAATLLVLGLSYLGGRYIKLKEPDKAHSKLKSDMDKMSGDIKELKGALSKTNVAKITEKQRYF